MTEQTGGVRPAVNRPASTSTVAEPTDRIRPWRADRRNVKALDRHIAHAYGPEYVRRWAA